MSIAPPQGSNTDKKVSKAEVTFQDTNDHDHEHDHLQIIRQFNTEEKQKRCCKCRKKQSQFSTEESPKKCCSCKCKRNCKRKILSCLKFQCCRKRKNNLYDDDDEWDENIQQNLKDLPPGFKDWLYLTFRKRNSIGRRARHKSRRVKGRKSQSSISLQGKKSQSKIPSAQTLKFLKEFDKWDFDVYKLHMLSKNHSLRFVILEAFGKYDIQTKFNIKASALDNFIDAMEHGYTYHKNPYHHDVHATDVTHNVHYLLSTGVSRYFTDLEIFALIFAAIIHDFEHNGRSNNFHVNAQTDLAVLYNDRSVLENHHLSCAFKILRIKECNIISDLTPLEFHEFRQLVIETVLATDMSEHFQLIKVVRAFLREGRWIGTVEKAILTTLSFILHAADICNPGKSWDVHRKWADLVMEEYFTQGEDEKKRGLPISPLCDRKSTVIPQIQVTFIELIVEPTLTLLGELIDMLLRSDFDDTIIISAKNRQKGRAEEKKKSVVQPSSPSPPPATSNEEGPRISLLPMRGGSGSKFGSISLPKPILTEKEARIHRASISIAYQPLVKPWVPMLIWNKGKWKQMTEQQKPVEKPKAKILDKRSNSSPPVQQNTKNTGKKQASQPITNNKSLPTAASQKSLPLKTDTKKTS